MGQVLQKSPVTQHEQIMKKGSVMLTEEPKCLFQIP